MKSQNNLLKYSFPHPNLIKSLFEESPAVYLVLAVWC